MGCCQEPGGGRRSERRVRCSCGLVAGLRQVQLQFRFCFPTPLGLLAQLPCCLGAFGMEHSGRSIAGSATAGGCRRHQFFAHAPWSHARDSCGKISGRSVTGSESCGIHKGRRRLGRHPGEYGSLSEALAVGPTFILRARSPVKQGFIGSGFPQTRRMPPANLHRFTARPGNPPAETTESAPAPPGKWCRFARATGPGDRPPFISEISDISCQGAS